MEARGAQVKFPIFFQTNPNLTEANVLRNNLSAVVTREHVNSALLPNNLQSIGGGQKAGGARQEQSGYPHVYGT
jgi:hypothetical protein